jgi:hypothetical protein
VAAAVGAGFPRNGRTGGAVEPPARPGAPASASTTAVQTSTTPNQFDRISPNPDSCFDLWNRHGEQPGRPQFAGANRIRSAAILRASGRVAQRESARFTRGRSLVQSQARP